MGTLQIYRKEAVSGGRVCVPVQVIYYFLSKKEWSLSDVIFCSPELFYWKLLKSVFFSTLFISLYLLFFYQAGVAQCFCISYDAGHVNTEE